MPVIRRATADDAPALAEFAARTYTDTFGASTADDDLALFLHTAYGAPQQGAEIADPAVDVFLAEEAGVLAGFAQLREGPAPDCVTDEAPIELWRFYVDRPWHGRGVAGALMDAVEHGAQARGAKSIWLSVWEENGRAQAYYAKAGFRPVGTKDFIVGTDIQTDWVLVRILNWRSRA